MGDAATHARAHPRISGMDMCTYGSMCVGGGGHARVGELSRWRWRARHESDRLCAHRTLYLRCQYSDCTTDLTCAPLSQEAMASLDTYYGPTASCEVRRAPALFRGLYPTHFLVSCALCDVIVCIASAFVSATLCDTLFNMFVPEFLLLPGDFSPFSFEWLL